MSALEVSKFIGIPQTTLIRRQKSKRLSPEESERLNRLVRVVDAATELFCGEIDTAMQWLQEPSAHLYDTPPVGMIRTDIGAREVESYINRISQGIYM